MSRKLNIFQNQYVNQCIWIVRVLQEMSICKPEVIIYITVSTLISGQVILSILCIFNWLSFNLKKKRLSIFQSHIYVQCPWNICMWIVALVLNTSHIYNRFPDLTNLFKLLPSDDHLKLKQQDGNKHKTNSLI